MPCIKQTHRNRTPSTSSNTPTTEYLTAAENKAQETSATRHRILLNASSSSRDKAMARMFCAAVSAEPSSCKGSCMTKGRNLSTLFVFQARQRLIVKKMVLCMISRLSIWRCLGNVARRQDLLQPIQIDSEKHPSLQQNWGLWMSYTSFQAAKSLQTKQ